LIGEKKLSGSKAIITGGAQGIGEAIAKIFAREGAWVIIADLNLEGGQQVVSQIEETGGTAWAIQADVTKLLDVTKMVEKALGQWETIDILVNNAGGFNRFSSIIDTSEEDWDRVIALNLKSMFLCSQALTKHMMEIQKGRIINMASMAGLGPNPYAPSYLPYGTAKAGVIGFTKHLAKELGPYNITVNAISPNTTTTPRVKNLRNAESLNRIADMSPLKHLIEPEDCAEAALFLASKQSRYITGVNLNVNGGTLMV
jgi:NAD(P)-dependent dehydrogenase (short-subunit alcohol dehydrogenase family)